MHSMGFWRCDTYLGRFFFEMPNAIDELSVQTLYFPCFYVMSNIIYKLSMFLGL